jgi:hypothetical protein
VAGAVAETLSDVQAVVPDGRLGVELPLKKVLFASNQARVRPEYPVAFRPLAYTLAV